MVVSLSKVEVSRSGDTIESEESLNDLASAGVVGNLAFVFEQA